SGEAPQGTGARAPRASAPSEHAGVGQPERTAEPLRTEAPIAVPDPAPHGRVYSVRYISWIWIPRDAEKPRGKWVKLGFIRTGYGVPLREPGLAPPRDLCRQGYYAIEPRGYVCADGTTTRDPEHPVVQAMHEAGVDLLEQNPEAVFPYHYAFSIGAPMYERLPTDEQHRLVMMRFRERPLKLGDWAKGFEDLTTREPIQANGPAPRFITERGKSPLAGDNLVRKNLPHGSMVSYSRAFTANGRVWLVTPDLTLVPADRVRPYTPSDFRGVELGRLKLPLAWARKQPREIYRVEDDALAVTGEQLAPGAPIELSGEERKFRGDRYVATRDGRWLRHDHVRVAREVKPPSAIRGDRTWIYLSLTEYTLVAYRGATPVYATLHAPGRGGTHRGKGSVKNYTTPLGAFPLNWKERWGTMSPDPGAPTSFWISDVMWTQYFKQPYALHGAYWHESFGERMSAGCPNLAPRDARWLFDFSEPKLPPGWQGISPEPGAESTLIVLGG
ncbi:MAG: L,D-transpeptidase, partial [Polyangiaceae bacterium]